MFPEMTLDQLERWMAGEKRKREEQQAEEAEAVASAKALRQWKNDVFLFSQRGPARRAELKRLDDEAWEEMLGLRAAEQRDLLTLRARHQAEETAIRERHRQRQGEACRRQMARREKTLERLHADFDPEAEWAQATTAAHRRQLEHAFWNPARGGPNVHEVEAAMQQWTVPSRPR